MLCCISAQGFNFQLAAVLLSIGIYAYIESGRYCACILEPHLVPDLDHPREKVSHDILLSLKMWVSGMSDDLSQQSYQLGMLVK